MKKYLCVLLLSIGVNPVHADKSYNNGISFSVTNTSFMSQYQRRIAATWVLLGISGGFSDSGSENIIDEEYYDYAVGLSWKIPLSRQDPKWYVVNHFLYSVFNSEAVGLPNTEQTFQSYSYTTAFGMDWFLTDNISIGGEIAILRYNKLINQFDSPLLGFSENDSENYSLGISRGSLHINYYW